MFQRGICILGCIRRVIKAHDRRSQQAVLVKLPLLYQGMDPERTRFLGDHSFYFVHSMSFLRKNQTSADFIMYVATALNNAMCLGS